MEQDDVLRRAIDVLETQGVVYLLVGSLASGVYGEPRLTLDIDIVVDLKAGQVAALCAAFPPPDYYVSEKAARDAVALARQFNVLHPTSGNKIDFMVARRDDWGRSQVARRRREQVVPGLFGFTAAPEDVILGKLWYYQEGESEKHLRDIAGILLISGAEVDRAYIAEWAAKLGLEREWQIILDKRI